MGKKQNMESMCKILQKDTDLEDPTRLPDQVYSGCAEREAKVDPQAVHSTTELFKK